jgi:hypothetical protein
MRLALLLAGLFLLTAGFVFSQESMTDDEFVDVSGSGNSNMDAFLGFRLGLTKDTGNEGEMKMAPGIAIGYSYWLQEINETISLGPVIRASLGFVNEVEVPVYGWTYGGLQQIPGQSQTVGWGGNTVLLNIDGLLGYGLKARINGMLNVIAKAGIAFNADTANYSYSLLGSNEINITSGSMMLGLGLDAGIQINPIKTLPIYAEIGFGFSFDFLGMLFSTIDVTDSNGESYSGYPISDSGNFEPQSFLSIGAPYIIVGWRL